jgi:hypothetical protein
MHPKAKMVNKNRNLNMHWDCGFLQEENLCMQVWILYK